jgi:hypothetical protein
VVVDKQSIQGACSYHEYTGALAMVDDNESIGWRSQEKLLEMHEDTISSLHVAVSRNSRDDKL